MSVTSVLCTLILLSVTLVYAGETDICSPSGKSADDQAHHSDYSSFNNSVRRLISDLEKSGHIGSLTARELSFTYHAEDRCLGSTNGTAILIPGSTIDRAFDLKVYNDGKGWACDNKDKTTFRLHFDLKEKIDQFFSKFRFECNSEKKSVYIKGTTESDYMVIHFTWQFDQYRIFKLEYRSEDPG